LLKGVTIFFFSTKPYNTTDKSGTFF